MSVDKQNKIIAILEELNFHRYGFAKLSKPVSMDYYMSWIESGYAGSMKYLKTHIPMKSDPQQLLPKAQSAIVVAMSYVPHPHAEDFEFSLKTARYAQGYDYHFWLKKQLDKVIERLQGIYPHETFRAFTDSAPVLERDLAVRAGLGWVGKNTCVLDQKSGSMFFIGEIYTTLDVAITLELHADRCGTCTRCIDACPTQAILEPRKLDARRCISYLTIESKEVPPPELRPLIGNHYFGCDICQTVCPWNQKAFASQLQEPLQSQEDVLEDLKFILNASNSQIEQYFKGTPLMRAPAWAHKRNALVVIANLKLKSLRLEVEKLCTHPRLSELAQWSLTQITSAL